MNVSVTKLTAAFLPFLLIYFVIYYKSILQIETGNDGKQSIAQFLKLSSVKESSHSNLGNSRIYHNAFEEARGINTVSSDVNHAAVNVANATLKTVNQTIKSLAKSSVVLSVGKINESQSRDLNVMKQTNHSSGVSLQTNRSSGVSLQTNRSSGISLQNNGRIRERHNNISGSHSEKRDLEHWVPDWYNIGNSSEEIEAMLSKRREDILKRCSKLPGYQAPPRAGMYKGEIWNTRSLMYCSTYKAGYTFWKVLFLREKKDKKYAPKSLPSKKVSFTVTRNPWHRLVSCWHDRFTLEEPLRSGFMSRFCNGKTWPTLPPFSEFIRDCVVKLYKLKQPPNYHWMPAIDRCHLCGKEQITYDYILAQENMDTEAIHMLTKHAGYDESISDYFKDLHKQILRPGEGSFSNNYQDYYRNISEEHMNILKEIYKYEIILFNYPKTPFVDFAKS